jgi:hypothetical protein
VYETLSHISAYEILAGLGAFFELVGFVWVVAGVSRALSEDYGELGFLRRLGRGIGVWLRYLFEEPPKVASGSASVSAGATINVKGDLSAVVTRADETDIQRLDRELGELRSQMDKHKEEVALRFTGVEERFTEVEKRVRETHEELSRRVDELSERLRQIHRAGLRKEKGGALVFMLGAVLSLIAALI